MKFPVILFSPKSQHAPFIIVTISLYCQEPVARLRVREVDVIRCKIRGVQHQFVVVQAVRSILVQRNSTSLQTGDEPSLLHTDVLKRTRTSWTNFLQ